MSPRLSSLLVATGLATALLLLSRAPTERADARSTLRPLAKAGAPAAPAPTAQLERPPSDLSEEREAVPPSPATAVDTSGSRLAAEVAADPIAAPEGSPAAPERDARAQGAELQRLVLDTGAPFEDRIRALRTLCLLEAELGAALRSDEIVENALWLAEHAPTVDDRRDAVSGLGGIRQPWAIERLGALLLQDPQAEVRRKVARVLAGSPNAIAMRYLERARESEPDAHTREVLERLLSTL